MKLNFNETMKNELIMSLQPLRFKYLEAHTYTYKEKDAVSFNESRNVYASNLEQAKGVVAHILTAEKGTPFDPKALPELPDDIVVSEIKPDSSNFYIEIALNSVVLCGIVYDCSKNDVKETILDVVKAAGMLQLLKGDEFVKNLLTNLCVANHESERNFFKDTATSDTPENAIMYVSNEMHVFYEKNIPTFRINMANRLVVKLN